MFGSLQVNGPGEKQKKAEHTGQNAVLTPIGYRPKMI